MVLHARVSAGRGTPRERRGDEHAPALGSVAVGARADGMSIAPPRRADRAGASSMILIESDSISVSDAASGKYRRRINHRDRDVDVAPACRGEDIEGAVAVEPDRSQLRLPAPGEQRASRQQNRRGGARSLARADGECKLRCVEAGAPLGGHIVGPGAGADGARARARLQHAHRSRERARSGRADRKLRALHAWLPAGPRHTCGWWVDVPGLEEVGDEVDRGVDRLAFALVPPARVL